MKKILIPILFVPFFLFAQEKEKTLESKIEKVTVFFEGAQLTRKADFQLEEGNARLLLKGLSTLINPQSIQVSTETNLYITGVEYRYNYLDSLKPTQEIEALLDKEKDLKEKQAQLYGQRGIYDEELNLLRQNQSLKGQNMNLQVAELKAAADFFRQRLTEIQQKQHDITKSIKSIEEQLSRIKNQMGELSLKRPEVTGEICISVNAKKAMAGNLLVSYYTSGAGWQPGYDIRVRDINESIQFVQKAEVNQKTGESWQKVRLVLSTGTPSLSNDKPMLSPWYLGWVPYRQPVTTTANLGISPYQAMISGVVLDRETGEPIPFASVQVKSNGQLIAGATTDFDGKYAIKPLSPGSVDLKVSFVGYQDAQISNLQLAPGQNTIQNPQMQASSVALEGVMITAMEQESVAYEPQGNADGARVRGSGAYDRRAQKSEMQVVAADAKLNLNTVLQQANYEYSIEIPYSIPSDGKNISVAIGEKQVPALYEYQAAPKLEKAVFLIARIPGWQDYQFISGNANLYFEGTFLGKSMLNANTTEDTLQLSLGRDRNLTIDRVKVKDKSSSQILGNNKKIQRGWEISLRNNRKQMIPLVLEDQIPLSNRDDVKVDYDIPEDAKLDATTGKLTWRLNLEAGATKKVSFKYVVKCPTSSNYWLE